MEFANKIFPIPLWNCETIKCCITIKYSRTINLYQRTRDERYHLFLSLCRVSRSIKSLLEPHKKTIRFLGKVLFSRWAEYNEQGNERNSWTWNSRSRPISLHFISKMWNSKTFLSKACTPRIRQACYSTYIRDHERRSQNLRPVRRFWSTNRRTRNPPTGKIL